MAVPHSDTTASCYESTANQAMDTHSLPPHHPPSNKNNPRPLSESQPQSILTQSYCIFNPASLYVDPVPRIVNSASLYVDSVPLIFNPASLYVDSVPHIFNSHQSVNLTTKQQPLTQHRPQASACYSHTTALLKSTTLPCPSVSRPSSMTWSNMLRTSGAAFSTSSKSTTL